MRRRWDSLPPPLAEPPIGRVSYLTPVSTIVCTTLPLTPLSIAGTVNLAIDFSNVPKKDNHPELSPQSY